MSLLSRLVRRDLRRRAVEAVLLLVALTVATTTLTLGLVLHGETVAPYARTRAATAGPDVVAAVFARPHTTVSHAKVAALRSLTRSNAVTGHSGPYPVTWAGLQFGQLRTGAEVEGRDRGTATVDQPALLSGGWVRPGEAVVEGSFADALGVQVGDSIRIGDRVFRVAGTAVTAAFPPYPRMCTVGCILDLPALQTGSPGLVWLTRSDARSMASPTEPLVYFLNLTLRYPDAAPTFAAAHQTSPTFTAPELLTWKDIQYRHAELLQNEQALVLLGSSLLGVLALATLVVLVGGRMAEERRRVGTLKAVGSSPGFVVVVLLTEYLVVALAAIGAGLLVGRFTAPLLTPPSVGLLGAAGTPSLTLVNVGMVAAVAGGVTVLATVFPALRTARSSTVQALRDPGRRPRRRRALIAGSARLPASLLVGVRLVARRPRRAVLGAVSTAVAVCGIVVVMYAQAKANAHAARATSGLLDPNVQRLGQVMLAVTLLLTVMAAVNLVFVAAATALDNATALAVTRALGASPAQAAAGLAAAQVIPALAGVALGLPAGMALFSALNHSGTAASPPLWWLACLPIGTGLLAVTLTALTAGLGSRRSIADILRAETA